MNETFGKALKELRESKGLSQQQLAGRLFVNRSSISNWESGRRIPDLIIISRLAQALDTDISELVNASEISEPMSCSALKVLIKIPYRLTAENVERPSVVSVEEIGSAEVLHRTEDSCVVLLHLQYLLPLSGREGETQKKKLLTSSVLLLCRFWAHYIPK